MTKVEMLDHSLHLSNDMFKKIMFKMCKSGDHCSDVETRMSYLAAERHKVRTYQSSEVKFHDETVQRIHF